MKKSNNKKTRDVTAFIYPRLSRDDNLEGESYSISNQKKLLTKMAKDMGYTNIVTFVDDGVSGVTMDRPGFNEMMRQLEEGKASALFVKDLSRLGRNYIEVGRLMEEFFPEHDIRLVAVSDNIDTAEGENELAPIRNLFNEWYARDISKKRRISNKIKGNAGEPMGPPPYGYIKDPDNPKHWIIEEEAASVVRRIFNMTLDGMGTEQIAAQLERDGVLKPRAYWHQRGINRPGKGDLQRPTKWNKTTVIQMLSVQEYCGDVLNFKTYSKSYKNKKRIDNAREDWMVFKDVHEPIIDRAVWEQIQEKRGKMRKRKPKDTERNIFSGLFERIYEDNLSGKLSDERFSRMSQRYEAEQLELKERMKTLRTEIEKLASESVSTDMFLSIVRKYTRAKKLTPRMLNELVNHIEVHQAEKIDGEWVQKLTIHYNCVGALFIPDTEALPTPEVTVNTRRGVYVTYEPAQNE